MPACFAGFKCRAGECTHTCCAHWEIDIDECSLARYHRVKGTFRKAIDDGITEDEDGAHFVLGNGERCAFLNERNLCEIYINLGEDALCDICREHPRWYFDLSTHTEMGYGLCCEEAAAMALHWQEPMELVFAEDDGAEDDIQSDGEEQMFALRNKLFDIVTDRMRSLPQRMDGIRDILQLPKISMKTFEDFLCTLETMDGAWTERLAKPAEPNREWTTAHEQLLWLLLWRHLAPALDDGLLRERILFVLSACELLHDMPGELEENVRLFSQEIEYSDKNPEEIFRFLSACIE